MFHRILTAAAPVLVVSAPGRQPQAEVVAGKGVAGVLLLGQVYILARHYVKLLFYASQTGFFQSALAHAEYTASPALVWPESPAVEGLTNSAPTVPRMRHNQPPA